MTVEYKGMQDNISGGTSDKLPVLIDKRYEESLAQITALEAENERLIELVRKIGTDNMMCPNDYDLDNMPINGCADTIDDLNTDERDQYCNPCWREALKND